jgi:hypothetical protein
VLSCNEVKTFCTYQFDFKIIGFYAGFFIEVISPMTDKNGTWSSKSNGEDKEFDYNL